MRNCGELLRCDSDGNNIPYGRKFWREDILADCWNYDIWRNLLWRLRNIAIIIFIAKWLIERTGNLTGPWDSFDRSYHSDAERENRLPIFLGKWPTTTPASVFTATAYTSFGSRWQANSRCTKPLGDVIFSYAAVDGELHADNYTGASSYRPIVHVEAMITNNNDSTL